MIISQILMGLEEGEGKTEEIILLSLLLESSLSSRFGSFYIHFCLAETGTISMCNY